jgi:hypothetical protein
MHAFSSYTDVSQMRCPNAAQSSASPLQPALTNEVLRRLNYLVNTFYNDEFSRPQCVVPPNVTLSTTYFGSKTTTGPGTYGPAKSSDVQAAVWALTGARVLTCSGVSVC